MSAHLPFHRSPVAPCPARQLPPSHLCCGPWGSKSSGGAETGPSRALGAYLSLFQQPLENIKAHSQLLSEAGVCSPQARPLRRPPLCIAGQPSNTPGPVPRREPRASAPRRHRSLEAAQEASTHPPTVQNQEPLPSLTPGGREGQRPAPPGRGLSEEAACTGEVAEVQGSGPRDPAQKPRSFHRPHPDPSAPALDTGTLSQAELWTVVLGQVPRRLPGRAKPRGLHTLSSKSTHVRLGHPLPPEAAGTLSKLLSFLCRRGRAGGASRSGWGREK